MDLFILSIALLGFVITYQSIFLLEKQACRKFVLRELKQRPIDSLFETQFWKRLSRGWREEKILKELPTFLELFSMALASGCHFEQAWTLSCDYLPDGLLKSYLLGFGASLNNGESVGKALQKLRNQFHHSSLRSVFSLLSQSMSKGLPLESILLERATHMRTLSWWALEKKAQTAPLRLLIPIFLFIFPTIFLVIFGPIFLYIKEHGSFF